MNRIKRTISAIVTICFFVNTVISDYAFALGTAPGSTQPATREEMYSLGQKLFAAERGPGVLDIGAIAPREFTGDTPEIQDIRIIPANYDKCPPEWNNNTILNETDLIQAFKRFEFDKARLLPGEIIIEEGYWELGNRQGGELPIARIERYYDGVPRLIIHTRFVQMWNDLRKNDVWFEYTFPDGTKRTVSLAWAIFYRVAKHEMADIAKADFAHKGGGHVSFNRHPVLDEAAANDIGGRYAAVNDALWMWFLGSYCFNDLTRYDNDTLNKRLEWFFEPASEEDRALDLASEFPNLKDEPAAKEKAIQLALLVNRAYFSRPNMRVAETFVKRKFVEAYEQRKEWGIKAIPATGRDEDAAAKPAAGPQLLTVTSFDVAANDRAVLDSTTDDAARVSLVKGIFNRAFGKAWEIITKAAGRDNAQGEHVDYNQEQFKEGKTHLFSMGGAIQNNFLATVARRGDDIIRIAHADADPLNGKGQVVEFRLGDLARLQEIAIRERKGKVPAERRVIPEWANHTMGTLMQAVAQKGLATGLDILLTSNVPHGAGLSNSAANCVAVTMALDGVFGWDMDKKAVVAFARDGEHDAFVGSSCGWLDQLLIVFSKAGFFALIDYAKMAVIKYFRSELPQTLQRVLVNTNVPHNLAQTEYTDRNYGELPKAHETLKALLPGREINGSTSLTLAEINRLINLFSGEVQTVDFADRALLKQQGLITDDDCAGYDRDTLPADAELMARFDRLGYAKPSYIKDGETKRPFRHAELTNAQSFALCLRRMRHQLTSAIRTPLTGKAAEKGDMASFGELINAEGRSLRMNGDFQITGDNRAQDALLDIGFAVGKELNIKVWGRMEGGGGGGNVGFYVDRSDEEKYREWRRIVTERYNEWAAKDLLDAGGNIARTKDGRPITAEIIEPVLADGASVVERVPATASRSWGAFKDQSVSLYTLTNSSGASVKISSLGGTVVSLKVPDRNGEMADVVLGHDSLAPYTDRSTNPYFGSIIGRYGNRIANGKFTLDGVTYDLATNNGRNHLHGGLEGFDMRVWKVNELTTEEGVGLELTYTSPDKEEGYPGNLQVTVTYIWTNNNELQISYSAITDKATPVNLTNHSYFNLGGHQSGSILGHKLMINSDAITPVADSNAITTGELMPVGGTPFDFREPAVIGDKIKEGANNEQLGYGSGGVDHNFVIAGEKGPDGLRLAAKLVDPVTGRTMDVFTDQPCVQEYTGNFLRGVEGKDGAIYNQHGGVCLETQHAPDSPNKEGVPGFPTTILRPGEVYRSKTVYSFGVDTGSGTAAPAVAPAAAPEMAPKAALALSAEQLARVKSNMIDSMRSGLADAEKSCLEMLPSFLQKPGDREQGMYLYVDVGGSNLRVGGVSIIPGLGVTPLKETPYSSAFEERHKTGDAATLFGFIAEGVEQYLAQLDFPKDAHVKLGVTWSFPMKKTGPAEATHLKWVKEWNVSGVAGQRIDLLLYEALRERGLVNVKIPAICNDTEGTLAQGGDGGVILGTGTNGALVIKIKDISKLNMPEEEGEMIVNTEWGNFNVGLPLTAWDRDLDALTMNKGDHLFEKMISGKYLGEITRRIIAGMIARGEIFNGIEARIFTQVPSPDEFDKAGFRTEHMSDIEKYPAASHETRELLGSLGVNGATNADLEALREVCIMVSTRAARLSAAAIAALVEYDDPSLERVHRVAIDGSVYYKYPLFKDRIIEALKEMYGDSAKIIVLVDARDGSGIGAAILAAVADRMERMRQPVDDLLSVGSFGGEEDTAAPAAVPGGKAQVLPAPKGSEAPLTASTAKTGLINLENIAGMPIFLNTGTGQIALGDSIACERRWSRPLKDAGDSIADPAAIERSPDREVYYGFRNVSVISDAQAVDANNLRFDITVLMPGLVDEIVDREFIMTKGHIHPGKDYAEIYEVWHGRALYVQQGANPATGKFEFLATIAGPGDKVLLFPGYSHRTVNIGTTPLVMANWISADVGGRKKRSTGDERYRQGPEEEAKAPVVKPDFSEIEKRHGYAYHIMYGRDGRVGIEPNQAYEQQVPMRFLLPAGSIPGTGLIAGVPMYGQINDQLKAAELSRFLSTQQGQDECERAFKPVTIDVWLPLLNASVPAVSVTTAAPASAPDVAPAAAKAAPDAAGPVAALIARIDERLAAIDQGEERFFANERLGTQDEERNIAKRIRKLLVDIRQMLQENPDTLLATPIAVGAFTETKPGERRVGLIPDVVSVLRLLGIEVFVEKNAGKGSRFDDGQYVASGARIVDSAEEVMAQAQILQHIKELQPDEYELVARVIQEHGWRALWNFNHFAECRDNPKRIVDNITTAATFLSFEQVVTGRARPILAGPSEKAGVNAAYQMALYLARKELWRGRYTDSERFVQGQIRQTREWNAVQAALKAYDETNEPKPADIDMKRAKVVVYGGGKVGYNQARVLALMNADVTVIERDAFQREWLTAAFGREGLTVKVISDDNTRVVEGSLRGAQGISTTAYVSGKRAQYLINSARRSTIGNGKFYTVVDIDQGGGLEGARATSHDNPLDLQGGDAIYAVANMPGAIPRQTSIDVSLGAAKYLAAMALYGIEGACRIYPELAYAADVAGGRITNPILKTEFDGSSVPDKMKMVTAEANMTPFERALDDARKRHDASQAALRAAPPAEADANKKVFDEKVRAYFAAKDDQDAKVNAYDEAVAAYKASSKVGASEEEKAAKKVALERALDGMLTAKNETMFCLEELWMESKVFKVVSIGHIKEGDIVCDLLTKEICSYGSHSYYQMIKQKQKRLVILRPLSLTPEQRAKRDELVAKLQANDRDVRGRYDALKKLREMVGTSYKEGILPPPIKVDDVFQHCHSTHSHSPSRMSSDIDTPSSGSTPSYIAWRGFVLGLQVTGIVDHDTVGGFGEFLEAARILGLRNPTCGYEQRLMPRGTPFEKMSTNSPGNKGETYVAFHAVSRARHRIQEERVIPAKIARFKKTAAFINSVYGLELDYDRHIGPLTEAGNPTEKHVAEAIAALIYKKYSAEVKAGNFDNVIAAANQLIAGVSARAGITGEAAKKLLITKEGDVKTAKDLAGFIVLMRNRVVIIAKQMPDYAPTRDEVITDAEMYRDAHENNELVYYLYLGDPKKCQAEDRRVLSRREKEALIEEWTGYYPEFAGKDFVIRWLQYDKASMQHLWFAYQKSIGADGIGLMPNRNSAEEIIAVIEAAVWAGFEHIANGMDVNLPRMPYTYFGYSNRPEFVEESLNIVRYESKARFMRAATAVRSLIDTAKTSGKGHVIVSARSGNMVAFANSTWPAVRWPFGVDLLSESDIAKQRQLASSPEGSVVWEHIQRYMAQPDLTEIVQDITPAAIVQDIPQPAAPEAPATGKADAAPEQLLTVIDEFTAPVAYGSGPAAVGPLTANELQGIYDGVNLFHQDKIEIFIHKAIGISPTMQRAIDDINKNQRAKTAGKGGDQAGDIIICRSPFENEEQLAKLLRNPAQGKRIIITADGVCEAQKLIAMGELLNGIRIMNVKLPENYGGLRPKDKTFYQAWAMNLGIYGRLIEANSEKKVKDAFAKLLKGTIEGDVDEYINNLVKPENQWQSPAERIGYFLGKMVRLSYEIAEQYELLKLQMKTFWTAA